MTRSPPEARPREPAGGSFSLAHLEALLFVPSDRHHPGARVHGCACAVCRLGSRVVVLSFHFCEGNRLGPPTT